MIRGRAFKAPRKAEWPPDVVCLTPTTWHSGGLLPSLKPGVAVAIIDVPPHMKWGCRALQHSELMTVFEIPSATQSSFPLNLCDQVCASLQNLAPVGVLCLLLSLLVPVKRCRFMGWCSPLEKIPSRKKVAASEIAKEGGNNSPLATLSPANNVAASEMAKEGGPMAKEGGPVVGTPSKESPVRFVKPSVSTTSTGAPMVIPLGLSVSSTPTAAPMVIPTRLPSKAPSLEEPQGKNQAVLKSSVTLG
jgi:hypothetical protein